jgi:hypothetical protein
MHRFDINIHQGTTFRMTLSWVDPAGDPIDLTGYAARMQVRMRYDTPTALVSLTESAGITLGGDQGTIAVELTAVQTAAIAVARNTGVPPSDDYYYDLEVEAPTGEVTRLVFGVARVYREVTR